MKWNVCGAAALILGLSSAVAFAQSSGAMSKGASMAPMKGMETTYTGCLEAGSAAGTYRLTHVVAGGHMGSMKDGDMRGSMNDDAMKKDSMSKGSMAKDGMAHDRTAPETLTLTGKSGDLKKHVGHNVSVTGTLEHNGMDEMAKDSMASGSMAPSFAVKSLKMVTSSCSSM